MPTDAYTPATGSSSGFGEIITHHFFLPDKQKNVDEAVPRRRNVKQKLVNISRT